MTKNWRRKKIYLSVYLFLVLLKGHLSYRRSFQPSKENIQHFKKWNEINCFSFFLFLWVIYALLYPDPIRNRIHNTASSPELLGFSIRFRILFLWNIAKTRTLHDETIYLQWMGWIGESAKLINFFKFIIYHKLLKQSGTCYLQDYWLIKRFIRWISAANCCPFLKSGTHLVPQLRLEDQKCVVLTNLFNF